MEIAIVIQGCSSNTKIYSLLRYFWNIWTRLFEQKQSILRAEIIDICKRKKKNKYSVSLNSFLFIKIKWFLIKKKRALIYLYVFRKIFRLLSTIVDHRYSTCASNYRCLINFVTIVSRCPCMESCMLCYSIRSTILFNTSRWQFTI